MGTCIDIQIRACAFVAAAATTVVDPFANCTRQNKNRARDELRLTEEFVFLTGVACVRVVRSDDACL